MKPLAILVASVLQAGAQVHYGTVGVVHFTQDKMSVAADSRGHLAGPGRPPDDTVCKIAALGGNVLFVSAGVFEYNSRTPGVPSWRNTTAAGIAYEKVKATYSTTRAHSSDIATEWARVVTENLNVWARILPSDFARTASIAEGCLVVALIGGQGRTGVSFFLL